MPSIPSPLAMAREKAALAKAARNEASNAAFKAALEHVRHFLPLGISAGPVRPVRHIGFSELSHARHFSPTNLVPPPELSQVSRETNKSIPTKPNNTPVKHSAVRPEHLEASRILFEEKQAAIASPENKDPRTMGIPGLRRRSPNNAQQNAQRRAAILHNQVKNRRGGKRITHRRHRRHRRNKRSTYKQ